MGNKWGPGCCDCTGVCVTPLTVSIYSSDSCLQGFVGTWTMMSVFGSTGGCVYDSSCRSWVSSFLPDASPSRSCSALSDTYLTNQIVLYAFGQNNGTLGISALFTWRWGAGVGYSNAASLAGRFVSTDYGVTFSGFEIDLGPDGCTAGTSSGPPTSGSDLTCSVTF